MMLHYTLNIIARAGFCMTRSVQCCLCCKGDVHVEHDIIYM